MLRGQSENRRHSGHVGPLERLRRRLSAPRQDVALTHKLADGALLGVAATGGRGSVEITAGILRAGPHGGARAVRVQAMIEPGQKVQALPKQRNRPKEAGQQPGRRNVQFSRHAHVSRGTPTPPSKGTQTSVYRNRNARKKQDAKE
jgi:hypothetical protein